MPIQRIGNLEIPSLEFGLSEEFWPQISAPVREEYDAGEIKDPAIVEAALKTAFAKCGELFMGVLRQEKRASFYLFIQHLFEDTIDLHVAIVGGAAIPVDQSDLSSVRRFLRVILEQAAGHDLTGHPNFIYEILQNRAAYILTMDKLLYLGYHAFGLSQAIARGQLFPGSVNFDINGDGLLGIGTEGAYKPILDHLEADIPRHNESVTLYHTLNDLIGVWRELGVEYGELTSFFADHIRDPHFCFSVINKDQFYGQVREAFPEASDVAIDFFEGLTIDRAHLMSFEDCILRSQDINRIIYRPLVEVTIDNNNYLMAAFKRWSECLGTLTTNALPWGTVAAEWMRHPRIRTFIQHLHHTHDAILEDAADERLRAKGLPKDKGVKSLRQHRGNNYPIASVQGVGEIDLLFADTEKKILYVVECKHNKARFDYFNWKRDLTTFKTKYEAQLGNKTRFAVQETERILIHLEVVNNIQIEDKASYTVNSIFLINAPTLYMYDAVFPTLTLHNLEELLDDRFVIPRFLLRSEDGSEFRVEQPYFTNLKGLLEAHR